MSEIQEVTNSTEESTVHPTMPVNLTTDMPEPVTNNVEILADISIPAENNADTVQNSIKQENPPEVEAHATKLTTEESKPVAHAPPIQVHQEAKSAEVYHDVKPEPDSATYQRLPDEFFKTIFYFSGMGTVIGSALSEGVHVDERNRGMAIEYDQIPARFKEQLHKDEFPLVVSCRDKANDILGGLRNLRNLLDNVPTYTESDAAVSYRPAIGSIEVKPDDPIHGHKYFLDNRRKATLQDAA